MLNNTTATLDILIGCLTGLLLACILLIWFRQHRYGWLRHRIRCWFQPAMPTDIHMVIDHGNIKTGSPPSRR